MKEELIFKIGLVIQIEKPKIGEILPFCRYKISMESKLF
jgi:hypothetical protein